MEANRQKLYKISKNIIWRKEKWNFMILFPVSKKFFVFHQKFSKYVDNNWYIVYSKKYEHIFRLLIDNKTVHPVNNRILSTHSIKNTVWWPLNVTFQITNRCNLDCQHCHRIKKDFEDMPIKEFKKIINELVKMRVFNVNISWGEPLLHPDILVMVAYVLKKWLNVTISTNLLLRTDIIAKNMSEIWLKHIHVSFDSYIAQSHDDIRGMNWAYQWLLSNFHLLKKHNIDYTLVTTIVNQSPKEYMKTIDSAFQFWATAHKTNTAIRQWDGINHTWNIIDFDPYKKIWIKKKNEYAGKMNVLAETMFLIQLWEEYISPPWIPNVLNCWCPAGILTCAITEKWDVLACPFFWDMPVGNIYKQSFIGIWNDSQLLKNIRNRKKIHQCNKCKFMTICWWCRARSYWLFKEINKEDPYCFLKTKNNG